MFGDFKSLGMMSGILKIQFHEWAFREFYEIGVPPPVTWGPFEVGWKSGQIIIFHGSLGRISLFQIWK